MMDTDWIATHLILTLPYAWAIKGVVFIILSTTLIFQKASDRLGLWVNALFIGTILTGLWATWLTTYLTRNLQASEIDSPQLWSLLIAGHAAPWIVNVTGLGVAYYTYRTTPRETEDERDRRQHETQELLDETSHSLAETGKINADRNRRISLKGLELDNRIIKLADSQRVHDEEGVRQDATDVRQDQREQDQDARDEERR